MSPVSHLDIWDYVSLSLIVILSCAIGLYQIYAARKASNTTQFLVSSNDLGVFPLILSIVASFFSAISFLGIPVEIYMHGLSFSFQTLTTIICAPIGMFLFLPVFFQLNRPSIFEYLELRFGKAMRMFMSVMWTSRIILTLGLAMYAPALALNQVTGLHLWASVVLIGVVCIVYTSMGGIRAVVWADAIQCVVMTAVYIMIIIKGTIDVGGVGVIWDRLKEGKRDEFIVWSSSPNSKYSIWSMSIGGSIYMLSYMSVTQTFMQRYLSCKTLERSRLTYIGGSVGVAVFYVIVILGGIVMYAYYHNCDPQLSGQIKFRDQSVALFAVETLSFCKGLAGIFVGGIMCATLSTLSSALNSLAAITLTDYVKSIKPDLSDQTYMKISKLLVVIYGVIGIGMVALAENLGGILMACFSILGLTGGCLLVVYTIGMALPWVNNKGAIIGCIFSIIIPMWAWIGNLVTKPVLARAPLNTLECSNYTTFKNFTFQPKEMSLLQQFYSVNSLWYTSWSLVIGIVVSLVASKIIGFQNASEVDPKLLFPFVSKYVNRLKLNKEILELDEFYEINGKK